MMPIDFIFIGPQKTGTTWVDDCLRRHPSIQLPERVKETHFFDVVYERGPEWYEACFPSRQPGTVRGEVAPSLFHHPEAPGRVAELAPDVRVWITLRHPVERARSHYHHHWSKGRLRGNFQEAVKLYPDILEAGRYAQHIRSWQSKGFSGQCSFLFNEDMRAGADETWDRLLRELGVEPEPFPEASREVVYGAQAPAIPLLARGADLVAGYFRRRGWHGWLATARKLKLNRVYRGGDGPPPLSEADIEFILTEHEEDVSYVEKLTGRDLRGWRRPPPE
jgi:hypothetical protein